MFIPNFVKVYGSQYTTAVPIDRDKGLGVYMNIEVKRSHLKTLDQPLERCMDGKTIPNSTSICIANFMEEQLNCSMALHGSISSNKRACNSTSQISRLTKTITMLRESDSNTIFDMTGCLASCEQEGNGPIDLRRQGQ